MTAAPPAVAVSSALTGITHPGVPVPGWDEAVQAAPTAAERMAALLSRRGRWSVSVSAHGWKTARIGFSKRL